MVNQIQNPNFANGMNGWFFYSDNPNNTCAIEGGQCVVRIGRGTGTNVQLYQPQLTIVAGKTYRLAFRARTNDVPRAIAVVLHEHAAPYANIGLDEHMVIGPAMTSCGGEFVASGSSMDARLRLAFADGLLPGDVLYIDDVVLEEVGVTPDPTPVDPPPVVVDPPSDPPKPTDYERGYAEGYAVGLGVGSGKDTAMVAPMLVAIAGVWVPNATTDAAP